MCIVETPTVTINGMKFAVVSRSGKTDQTTAKQTMNYTEALAYSKGKLVASSS